MAANSPGLAGLLEADALADLARDEACAWACDTATHALGATPGFRRLFDLPSSGGVTLASLLSRIEPTHHATLRDHLLARHEDRATFAFDVRTLDERWIHFHGRIARQGDALRTAGMAVDVTQRRLEVERELHESRALLQAVVDGSPTIIFMKDLEGRYGLVNDAAQRLMGRSLDAILGHTDFEIYPPDAAEHLRAVDRRVVEEGRVLEFEETFRTPDGVERTFITVKSPLRDDVRGVYGVCGVALEITDRKRAEEALLASNDRFSKAFRLAPYPMAISRFEDGRFLDVNDAYAEMTGYRRDEMVGRTSVGLGLITQEARDELAARREAGTPLLDFALTHRTKDGRTLELRASTHEIEVDGMPCLLTALRDETQLRRTEEAAEARANELAAVLEAAPAAIWLAHDPDCRVVTGSRAGRELLRVGPPANLSKSADTGGTLSHFKVLRHGREVPPDQLPLQRAARGEVIRDYEEQIVFASGETIHLLGHAVPLTDGYGQPRGAVAAFIDITRLHNAMAELSEAGRRKDEFLAMLGHELRNPLAPIQSCAHLLAQIAPDSRIEQIAAILQRQSRQLTRLVNDLLDVSRITHGKITLNPEDVSVRSIVDSAVEASRPLVESARHALDVTLEDEAMRVVADPVRISQVVSNLLNNAAKYTPAGGRIELAARFVGDELRIAVRDNGAGLPPGSEERIFRLFEQGDGGHRQAGGGLGVGLALALSLAQLHGGTIAAESDGPGLGSAFELRIPRSPAPPPRDPAPADRT